MFAKSLNGFLGSFSLMKLNAIFLGTFIVCYCLRIANTATGLVFSGRNDSVSKASEKKKLFNLIMTVLVALFLLIVTVLLINYGM